MAGGGIPETQCQPHPVLRSHFVCVFYPRKSPQAWLQRCPGSSTGLLCCAFFTLSLQEGQQCLPDHAAPKGLYLFSSHRAMTSYHCILGDRGMGGLFPPVPPCPAVSKDVGHSGLIPHLFRRHHLVRSITVPHKWTPPIRDVTCHERYHLSGLTTCYVSPRGVLPVRNPPFHCLPHGSLLWKTKPVLGKNKASVLIDQ